MTFTLTWLTLKVFVAVSIIIALLICLIKPLNGKKTVGIYFAFISLAPFVVFTYMIASPLFLIDEMFDVWEKLKRRQESKDLFGGIRK